LPGRLIKFLESKGILKDLSGRSSYVFGIKMAELEDISGVLSEKLREFSGVEKDTLGDESNE
jgi:hypothetical protein